MEQICDALAYLQRKGFVYQNLSPSNIRILQSGGVKLMGLRHALGKEDAASGHLYGGSYCMAPEEIRGERASPRSDVFGLGCLFYELLSGQRPFTGPDIRGVLEAVLLKNPVPLPSIVSKLPPALGALVDRALAKLPTDRYADAGEMLRALRSAYYPPVHRAFVDRALSKSATDRYVSAEQMLEALRSAYYERVRPEAVVVTDTSPARQLGPSLSSLDDTPQSLKASLQEIDQYLADILPPLIVRDAVEEFRRAQVEGSAAELWAWAHRVMEGREEYDLVALLYHALQKLNRLAVLNLMPRDPLLDFLKKVGEALSQACEPEDRERLRRALKRLGDETLQDNERRPRLEDTDDDLAPPTPHSRRLSILEERLRREGLAKTPTAHSRRLSILEQRLRREDPAKAPAHDPIRRRVIAQALAAAAAAARNNQELSSHLRRLSKVGVPVSEDAVFKNLGNGLANWALPRDLARDTAALAPPAEVVAMEKIVALADAPEEVARRYRQLVDAAVKQFNGGHLGRAVQMFELARRMALAEKIELRYVAPIRSSGHDALDTQQLRRFMERPERHGQLQQMMAFFEGGLGVSTLLDRIETEEDQAQRRLLLDLLAVHEKAARTETPDRLAAALNREGGTRALDVLIDHPLSRLRQLTAKLFGLKLDLYELPAVLGRVADEGATGTLTLRPQKGSRTATLGFIDGRPVVAHWGRREGLDALYQLFERPFPGRYAFEWKAPSVPAGAPRLPDVPSLLREGLRRAQELERTSALLPDDIPLEATGRPPSPVPEEPDYDLIRYLWNRACGKITIAEMETDLTVDAYRVRRPLAHWVEEGALKLDLPEVPEAAD
jgi:hypothetical protein